jgi:hypothetical protein
MISILLLGELLKFHWSRFCFALGLIIPALKLTLTEVAHMF